MGMEKLEYLKYVPQEKLRGQKRDISVQQNHVPTE